jgi:hypothetical protein
VSKAFDMRPPGGPEAGPEPEKTGSLRSSRPRFRPRGVSAICFAVLALGLAGPLATGTDSAMAATGRATVVTAASPPQAARGLQIIDGAGTMTVSPTSVPASGTTTLTFTYTAAPTQPLQGGWIALDAPQGWTPPALAGRGGITVVCVKARPYCDVSHDKVSVGGQRVTIAGINLNPVQSLTITYTEATVPASAGQATFNTFEQSNIKLGSLTAVNPPPGVMVTCADGVGTVTVSPGRVAAASTRKLIFTYAPPAGCVVADGTVSLKVPPGWTLPSATPGTAGYIAASPAAQSISVSGNAITATGVTLAAGQALTITYHQATAPGSATTSTFAAGEQSAGPGKPISLLSSPHVTVRPVATSSPTPSASTGSPSPTNGRRPAGASAGTMTVSPGTVVASHPGTLTFTYRAPARGLARSGEITLLVPPGWTPPSVTPGQAGYATSRPGAASVSGRRITVTGAKLGPGQPLVVTYRPTAAPQAAGTSVFAASERAHAINLLTALARSPSVVVAGRTPFHLPIQLVLVLLAAACVAAAAAIRFLRHPTGPVPPPHVQALPHSGPPGMVSIQPSRAGAAHAVSIEPHPGAPVMTVEETQR